MSPSPNPTPKKYALDEFKNFKEFFEDSGLKWWIMAAGIGGLAELSHVLWLAFVHVCGRLHP